MTPNEILERCEKILRGAQPGGLSPREAARAVFAEFVRATELDEDAVGALGQILRGLWRDCTPEEAYYGIGGGDVDRLFLAVCALLAIAGGGKDDDAGD